MTPATNVNYLRVSVTDRCNLRCVYCNPLDGDRCLADADLLSFDEIYRVVRLCTMCGVTRVRLTGGEPLVRENIVALVRKLSGIAEIKDLSLTTNGVLLAHMAAQLKRAGLNRVNISLDAAEGPCYRRLTGADALSTVIGSIDTAVEEGLTPVRINCVVLGGVNLTQVTSLAQMTLRRSVSVRFIEYYPTGDPMGRPGWYVPNRRVRRLIESRFGSLTPTVVADASGPAVYFRAPGAVGTIGFISGRSSVFCRRCSRLRLTCDGRLKPCLHAPHSYDVSGLLRTGAGDAVLLGLIQQVLGAKRRYTKAGSAPRSFSMQHIGG